MNNNIFKSFLILSVFFAVSISNSLFAQDTTTTTTQNYEAKASIGASYLTNDNSNNYINLGLQDEFNLGLFDKSNRISALLDLSFLAGLNNAKDNYMANIDAGLRLSVYRGDNLRLYFDLMTGMTLNYVSSPKGNYLGNNTKLSMGLNYDFLSVELSTMFINTEIGNVGLSGLGVRINF